jgi:hypothetical protein
LRSEQDPKSSSAFAQAVSPFLAAAATSSTTLAAHPLLAGTCSISFKATFNFAHLQRQQQQQFIQQPS